MDADAVYQTPTVEEIASILPAKFASVKVTKPEPRRVYATVPREDIFAVCTYIHDNLTFEHCTTLLGVDYVDHMSVVYHLSNYYNGVMIELDVESVTSIWEGANWHERETWELFGIVFDNHPKLERLLTPKTYEFFPFRKSYKLRGSE